MPVRGVVGHQVEDQLQAQPVRLGQQRVEIIERAEQRVYVGVVRDVVAEIGLRRAEDRRQPHRMTPSATRWGKRCMRPLRSPTPSSSLSWKERG
jgi:hypothetical protein